MNYRNLCAGALLAVTAGAAAAMPVGQPFAVIEGSGSLLNNFQFGAPSDILSVTLTGTVVDTYGWDAADGLSFAMETNPVSDSASFTLGTTTFLDPFGFDDPWLIDGTTGGYPYDAFAGSGPGDLVLDFLILPDLTNYTDNGTTVTVEYAEPFAAFGPRTDTLPEFPLQLSIYLNSPLPTKMHQEFFEGVLVDEYSYIEGALDIAYMTLGYPGGEPLPPVPVPAALPLMLGALGMAGLIGRRRRS